MLARLIQTLNKEGVTEDEVRVYVHARIETWSRRDIWDVKRNTPTHQRTNTPTHQRTNTPTHQRTNAPTLQHTNTPTRQVLDVLDALEEHLSDMDMARDFHDSLGGVYDCVTVSARASVRL